MAQRKINSFFNSNFGAKGNSYSSQPDSMPANPKREMYWNYKTSNQTLRLYQSKRKEQRANKKVNDQLVCSFGSELSTPTDSQVFEDSQTFPSSQSQDSVSWNPRSSNYLAGRQAWGRSSFYGQDVDVKPNVDYRQYLAETEKLAKEKEEKEMLENFLVSAKKCCEEGTLIATEVKEKLESHESSFEGKLHAVLKSDLTEKLLNENKENIEKISCEILEQTKTINNVTSLAQKSIQQSLEKILEKLVQPKVCYADMSTQYSPKIKTITMQCQTSPIVQTTTAKRVPELCYNQLHDDLYYDGTRVVPQKPSYKTIFQYGDESYLENENTAEDAETSILTPVSKPKVGRQQGNKRKSKNKNLHAGESGAMIKPMKHNPRNSNVKKRQPCKARRPNVRPGPGKYKKVENKIVSPEKLQMQKQPFFDVSDSDDDYCFSMFSSDISLF